MRVWVIPARRGVEAQAGRRGPEPRRDECRRPRTPGGSNAIDRVDYGITTPFAHFDESASEGARGVGHIIHVHTWPDCEAPPAPFRDEDDFARARDEKGAPSTASRQVGIGILD